MNTTLRLTLIVIPRVVFTNYHYILFLLGVSVQPSTPNVAVSEGGGTGGGGGGGTGTGPQAMVCIQLASGNLQRDVSVRVMTISSPTATGITIHYNYIIQWHIILCSHVTIIITL